MEGISLSIFHKNEQHVVRKLILEGLKERFGYIDWSCNPDIDDINKYYLNNGSPFIVAKYRSKIIGTGSLLIKSNKNAEIARVTVQKLYRRKGIGKKIVNYLINVAKLLDCKYISTTTEIDWYSATELYRKCGMKESYRDDIDIHMCKKI